MSTKKLSLAALWSQRLDQWKASGKSAAQWSRENEVSARMLFYWRDKFSKEPRVLSKCSKAISQPKPIPQFVELEELSSPQSIDSGISIAHQDMLIHLSRDFDQDTFLKCIQTLKIISSRSSS